MPQNMAVELPVARLIKGETARQMGCVMTKAAQYWQYAEEALRGASEIKSDKEKQVLIKLARLWSQAALKAEVPLPRTAPSAATLLPR